MSEAQGPPRLEMIAGESVLRRPARALLGWMSRQDAIAILLGRNPTPNEDISGLGDIAEKCIQEVSSRVVYSATDPRVADDSFTDALEEVAKRPGVQANFHNLTWDTALVDLTRVLSFQKIIFTDDRQLDERYDTSGLMEICLPSEQPAPPVGAINDPDGKGFTISSLNSNLRIAGSQLSEAMVAPGPGQATVRMQAVTFFVSMGASYLQVIEYRGRCFLRDGYHRASRLLQNGINVVPCIYIHAKSFEEFQTPIGSLSYEILYGDHPPTLTDFWDTGVSAEVSQLATRKVLRIRGDELVVPR